jgi:hypothetical protein
VPGVTIWALESDYDALAIQCLAAKLVAHLQLGNVHIRAVGPQAKPKPRKGEKDPAQALKRRVELYLEEHACVIFVIDSDSPMALNQRRQEPNSFINQVKRVIADQEFKDRVYLAPARQELEAWLLVDCVGIFCYFAQGQYKVNCREAVSKKRDLANWLKKCQRGDTQVIIEAEMGGKGVKEHLRRFSEEILLKLKPQMPHKNIRQKEYKENLSPEIAKYIEINAETLRRNASLQHLGNLIAGCCSKG